jgi:cellulose synthase/poly-beta-1,6-N-acetylglucosamine synthase-like glycosyltransferase
VLSELQREGQSYDAYVVVDADSTVSPNFLQAMNAHLAAGARVVQAYYTVLPVSGRRSEALREAALTLVHYLRPSAKRALHLSAGLKGNGMAFDRSVIDRFGWPTAGLAEDVEFHLMLVRAGVRVTFAPEAVVRGEMPGTLASSRSQQERWEAGRLATIRTQAVPLIARGLVQHNPVMVDAGVEQLVPPLSVPVGLAIVTFVVGRVAGIRMVWVIAVGAIGFFLVHVVAALLLARAPRRAYGALAQAPFYIVWKVFLYGRSLAGRHERRWVRTERLSEQQEAGH